MKTLVTLLALLMGTAGLAQTPERKTTAALPAPQALQAPQPPKSQAFSDTVAVQVMLDRAGFSPGAIDGQPGANLKRALAAFQRANALMESGLADDQTRQRLGVTGNPPLTAYQISEADVAGPFTTAIPSDLMAQSKLEKLGYQNALEAIAERFHATPQLLRRLNTAATFSQAGEQIQVPNVEPFDALALAQGKPSGSAQPAAIASDRGRGRGTAQQGGTAQRGAAPAGRGRGGVVRLGAALRLQPRDGRLTLSRDSPLS
jgi:peptidoglycan hydrolase-like protein with peptidoglycan-binding domain